MILASSNDGDSRALRDYRANSSADKHRQEDGDALLEPVSRVGVVREELEGNSYGGHHGEALQGERFERRVQDVVHQHEAEDNDYDCQSLPQAANLLVPPLGHPVF